MIYQHFSSESNFHVKAKGWKNILMHISLDWKKKLLSRKDLIYLK